MTARACSGLPLVDVSRYSKLLAGDIRSTFVPLLAYSDTRAGEITQWWRALQFGVGDVAQVYGGASEE